MPSFVTHLQSAIDPKATLPARTIGAQKDEVADGKVRVSQKLPRDQDGGRLGFDRRGGRVWCRGQHEQ